MFSIFRSSHQRCFVRKGVLRNFAKFTGKHLCQSLFFNKVAGLRPATLLKKRLWHRCFPMNFAKFLRTSFLQNTSGRLLLNIALKLNNRTWKKYKSNSLRENMTLKLVVLQSWIKLQIIKKNLKKKILPAYLRR